MKDLETNKVEQQKVFRYLDALREDGIVNMFGAIPFILGVFPQLSWSDARDHLSEWMRTYNNRHKEEVN